MATLLVADDAGVPLVTIAADEDGYHGVCTACGKHLFHHRKTDLIDIAETHVDTVHTDH